VGGRLQKGGHGAEGHGWELAEKRSPRSIREPGCPGEGALETLAVWTVASVTLLSEGEGSLCSWGPGGSEMAQVKNLMILRSLWNSSNSSKSKSGAATVQPTALTYFPAR
jgi:hypothetical protein